NISYEKPEQPPGRTATRSANSGLPSASSRSLTLMAASSVRVITSVLLVGSTQTLSVRERDLARLAVDKGVELVDLGAADRLHEPFDDAAVERADELGMGLGELPVGAVRERDDCHLPVVRAGHGGVEPEPGE